MSDHAHAHSHGAGTDHVPHVTPLWVYLATWGTLIVLTAITVGASYVNFGAWNLIIALFIATIKAAVVAALFMHLLHDHRFHTLILVSGGLFLIIFVAFTMFDTEYRGRADAVAGERPADITRPFEMTKSQAQMKEKYEHAAVGTHASAGAVPSTMGHNEMPAPSAEASAMASGSATAEPRQPEPLASGSASPSASAIVVPSASVSAPPVTSATIAPVPGAAQPPAASAHP